MRAFKTTKSDKNIYFLFCAQKPSKIYYKKSKSTSNLLKLSSKNQKHFKLISYIFSDLFIVAPVVNLQENAELIQYYLQVLRLRKEAAARDHRPTPWELLTKEEQLILASYHAHLRDEEDLDNQIRINTYLREAKTKKDEFYRKEYLAKSKFVPLTKLLIHCIPPRISVQLLPFPPKKPINHTSSVSSYSTDDVPGPAQSTTEIETNNPIISELTYKDPRRKIPDETKILLPVPSLLVSTTATAETTSNGSATSSTGTTTTARKS